MTAAQGPPDADLPGATLTEAPPARRAPARGGICPAAADLASLLRIHTAGFEALVFVLGPLIGGWRGKAGEFFALWSIGIIVNSYIFVLDDLVDLPHDRANPKRSRRPLVDGRVSTRVALGLSISFPLAALMIAAISGWPLQAEAPFAAVLIIAAFANVYHQVTRRPLLMDLLYATAMASPVPICSLAVLHSLTLLTWSATAALFLLALQLNSIAGNLKDLEPDRRTGFRTVALAFGVTLASDDTLRPGSRYRRYCWILQSLTWLTLALTLTEAVRARTAWEIAAIALAALIASAVSTRDLARLLSGARKPSQTGRELYFAAEFAVLLLAVAVHSHPVPFLTALGLLAIWTSGFGIYGRSHRPIDGTDGPVLEHQELRSVTGTLALADHGRERLIQCLHLTRSRFRWLSVPAGGDLGGGPLVPAARLSHRDVEELLAERDVNVDHVTVYGWVQRFTLDFIEVARTCRHAPGDQWFVDETYVKVDGQWTYLYRTIDQHSQVIDVMLSAR